VTLINRLKKVESLYRLYRATVSGMDAYLSFLAVALAALLVPGPDTLVVLRVALAGGSSAGVWAAAGSSAGLLLWGTATVVGVTALLTLSAVAFGALKLLGAAYLCWLGVQALRSAWRGESLTGSVGEGRSGLSPRAAFRRGLVCDLANVKVALFWTALVPQFMDGGGPALGAAMAVSMPALAFVWLTGYAAAAGKLRSALSGARVSRGVNGATGSAMVALAVKLAVA
jgi:threonine/homoserine/homoserine lactone efflux protein